MSSPAQEPVQVDHVTNTKPGKSNRRRKSWALVVGILALGLVGYVWMGPFDTRCHGHPRYACANNLRSIAKACQMYADANGIRGIGQFPPNLDVLLEGGEDAYLRPTQVICRECQKPYVYIPGRTNDESCSNVVAYEPLGYHKGDRLGGNIATVDGPSYGTGPTSTMPSSLRQSPTWRTVPPSSADADRGSLPIAGFPAKLAHRVSMRFPVGGGAVRRKQPSGVVKPMWALGLAALLMTGKSAAAGSISFPVVQDGQPIVRVVVEGDNETLTAAVKDLETYVERISGAKLEVTKGTEDLPGPTLHLGETALFPRTADARKQLIADGFVIARIAEDLIIAGNLPQAAANGIWTVLQDQFGVRWYYAGPLWEIVPQRESLTITFEPNASSGVYLENPSFHGRKLWGRAPTDAFGRRMRLTQKGVPLPYVGAGHHLNHVVNPDKHGDHPDYFAYYDGRRHVEGGVHPCFTHPDMFDVFMEHVRGGGGGSFGVIDNLTACKCERCLAVDGKSEPYMGMWNFSESFFQLMVRVAEQTAKEFPDRRLGVFAYQLTNAPPKTVDHIGKNVDVVLCQDTSQYFDPEYKRIDQEMSAEWVRKCGHVRFYDYIGINYWMPRYFPHILSDQFKHIARVGVAGYGTHSTSMIDTSMPMFYLLYQLLWDANTDPDQLVDEMIRDLYGKAAGPIADFYKHWEECWQRQTKGRWFWGMDNFRGEMKIYTPADIKRGHDLLLRAAAAARREDEKVKQRVQFLKDRYEFTRRAAEAHFISTNVINWTPTANEKDAIGQSARVVWAWETFARALDKVNKLKGTSVSGWLGKTGRVRAWGLKQQMRDAALAPLVRWACANEGRVEPDRLRTIEKDLANLAVANRTAIEKRVTKRVDAAYRKPRADGLRVPDVPRVDAPITLRAVPNDWPGVPRVEAAEWVFRARPPDQKIGKYQEPMLQNYVDPPALEDQSMTWQCAWDDDHLYIRIVVHDDKHEQGQLAPAMWKEDSVQIAFNPERDNFTYNLSSWDYIWGGYHRNESEFGISAHGNATDVHVWRSPPGLPKDIDVRSMIRAKAARHGTQTIYETAVDWRLLTGFNPEADRSFGVCIVVNDTDHGQRRSAEYGSGIASAKRPTEFAGLRLRRSEK